MHLPLRCYQDHHHSQQRAMRTAIPARVGRSLHERGRESACPDEVQRFLLRGQSRFTAQNDTQRGHLNNSAVPMPRVVDPTVGRGWSYPNIRQYEG